MSPGDRIYICALFVIWFFGLAFLLIWLFDRYERRSLKRVAAPLEEPSERCAACGVTIDKKQGDVAEVRPTLQINGRDIPVGFYICHLHFEEPSRG